jgi:DNA polymerase V
MRTNTGELVGFLDADSFYVSAERVRDRRLMGMPVAVLGNQGACVIARSYELRQTGVKVGDPVWEAAKICPQAVFIQRDFRWYEVLSRQMYEVVCSFSPCVEYYSIDEFFFTVRPQPGETLTELAVRIRDTIREQTGLPVTVAIARTRTLAKLLADTAKPFGARAVVDPDEQRQLLAHLPVTEIAGIAGRRQARLAPYGVKSCLDLARMDRRLVRAVLTVTGEKLHRELNGEPVDPIRPQRLPHQTISRGGSIGRATADPMVVRAWLVRNLERLIEELEYHRVRPGRVGLWLVYRQGPVGTGAVSLEVCSDRFDLLLEAFTECFEQAWRAGELVTGMHLVAMQLHGEGPVQRGLFEPPPGRAEALARLKRSVNTRVRRFALRSGATLYLPREVYDDWANDFDICDIRGKVCF